MAWPGRKSCWDEILGRIRFANQLRGIAALLVAMSHLIGVYWALPDVVSSVTATPPQLGPLPGIFWFTSFRWFNLGPFGVAIFFLISGMVVPFSLEHHGRGGFLLARVLRIYPTYAAALATEIGIVLLSSRVWDRPVPFTPALVAGNLSLLYDLMGQSSIDLVNWTLSVELKFYLLVALLAPIIRRGSAFWVVLAGGALCATNFLLMHAVAGSASASPSTPAYTFSSQSLCIIYMFIGTLFNFHLRGKVGTAGLVAGIAALALQFVASWAVGVWRAQFPPVTATYLYAFLLFSTLYSVRSYVPANRPLEALAAISFPFYVLHSLLGYTFLRTAMVGFGLPYYSSLTISTASVILLSTLFHLTIEKPTQRLGRQLGSSFALNWTMTRVSGEKDAP